MLNTNLDTFLTPDLAFFAPLDAVGSFADNKFCLWNGLIGSAPAHPALAYVIEWMVNLVSGRADMYDMERTVCKFSGADKIENWKIRTEPGLMLSGPCALGLAMNNAIGNEPLLKFTPGLIAKAGYNRLNVQGLDSDTIGNVMILSVSTQIPCAMYVFILCSSYSPLNSLFNFRLTKMTLGHFALMIPNEMLLSLPLTYQVFLRHHYYMIALVRMEGKKKAC